MDEIDSLSDGAKQFLSMMVSLSPAARPSLDAVVRHPVFDAAPKWQMRKRNAAFLSHFKHECGTEARLVQRELQHILPKDQNSVFLDSENLSDPRLLLEYVKNSDVLLVVQDSPVPPRRAQSAQ